MRGFWRLGRLEKKICMLDSVHIILNKRMHLDIRGRSEIHLNDFIFFCLPLPQKNMHLHFVNLLYS